MSTETSTRPQYETIDDVKRANRSAGYHWFDRDTMRWFDSRVSGRLYHNRYFISSERFRGFSSPDGDRAYTIREAMPDGQIEPVGAFQEFPTMGAAIGGLKRYMRSEASRLPREPWERCTANDDCGHLASFSVGALAVCDEHLFAAIEEA